MRNNKITRVLLILLGSVTSVVFGSDWQNPISECRQIQQDDKRLACYDKISIKNIKNKAKQATAKVADKPATKVDINEFGLKAKKENEPDAFVATVVKLKKNPYGLFTITLDNGQIWKQIDSRKFRLKVDNKIQIEKGALGSFKLKKVDSNASTRVKRVK